MNYAVMLEYKKTKRDLIIELYRKGLSRKEIAKQLGTYYNYVSDVIRSEIPK